MPMFLEQVSKTFKVPHLLNYMELPNQADLRLDKHDEQIKMLAQDNHPPVIDLKEWEEAKKEIKAMKETIKILKNMKVFKKLGK